jgi:hypothetical protein
MDTLKRRALQTIEERIASRETPENFDNARGERRKIRKEMAQKRLKAKLEDREKRKSMRRQAREDALALRLKKRVAKVKKRHGLENENQDVAQEIEQNTSEQIEEKVKNGEEIPQEETPQESYNVEEAQEEENFDSYTSSDPDIQYKHFANNSHKVRNYVKNQGEIPKRGHYSLALQAQGLRDAEVDNTYHVIKDSLIAEGEHPRYSQYLADNLACDYLTKIESSDNFDNFGVLDPQLWATVGNLADKGLMKVNEQRKAKGLKPIGGSALENKGKDDIQSGSIGLVKDFKNTYEKEVTKDKLLSYLPIIVIVLVFFYFLGRK